MASTILNLCVCINLREGESHWEVDLGGDRGPCQTSNEATSFRCLWLPKGMQ